MSNVESGVQTLYYGLGIVFMLGGAVVAYVKALQSRIGKQEQAQTNYKLEAAQHHVSKEYMNESERRILDSIRDLARRIDKVLHITASEVRIGAVNLQGDQTRYDNADEHGVCNPYSRCRNDNPEHFRLPNA
jgi:hypothetical protein